jgi:RNA polymerase sigma-70 factor (ECF subfamily)
MKEMNQLSEMISGFRRGNLQATHDLYTIHYASLLYFTERIIRDHAVAGEIVMETFIKLINRRSYFDSITDIKAFLFITARNASMDFLRYGKNGRIAGETAAQWRESEFNLSDDMQIAEANRLLQSAVDNLPVICKQVFNALFAEGLQTPAASRQLEIDPREMLIYRRKVIRQLQAVLSENDLYSSSFLIHYLTVACRKGTAVAIPVPVNR